MRAFKYLLFALLVVQGLPAFVSGQVNPADAWERRLNELQPPDKVLEAIGVLPGMVIGEVGAGRGRYTVHLARGAGPEGRVYANDIDAGSLAYLRERCQRDGVGNVVTILGKMDDPLFPPSGLDLVFMAPPGPARRPPPEPRPSPQARCDGGHRRTRPGEERRRLPPGGHVPRDDAGTGRRSGLRDRPR
jgi:SAM-dependent methyltransferase